MEKATFWNHAHPLSEQATKLFDSLVPDSGHCATVVGELLRASNKITYDWFNNGWGCNNWSGAVCFLQEYAASELNLAAETVQRLNKSLDYVHGYSHGEPAGHLDFGREPCDHVTTIHEIIVQGILDKAPEDWTKNAVDMYELQEEDYRHEEEDEDEDEDEDGYYN